MNEMRARFIFWAVLIVALVSISIGAAWATDPTTIWPTYHGDMIRGGHSTQFKGITNPASMNLIWAFPRATNTYDEDTFIVDPSEATFTNGSSPWITESASQEAYNLTFLWAPVVVDRSTYRASRATWAFPSSMKDRLCQIWIWVPFAPEGETTYSYTKQAEYTVTDDEGATTIKFDQSNGGTWQLLSSRLFSFENGGSVVLTNYTDDLVGSTSIRVAADSIKFVPATGQEIYSSPTSAEIDFSWHDLTKKLDWSGRIPVVYTGTVERPFIRDVSPETGAIYCINSITPNNSVIGAGNPLGNDVSKGLAELLGTTKWRYPRDYANLSAGETSAFLAVASVPSALGYKLSNLEGPLEGGVYSSPTLGFVNGNLTCFVTTVNRQVYALDAVTGTLMWQGPGVTVSESDSIGVSEPVVALAPNPQGKLRNDAHGGRFHYFQCQKYGTANPVVTDWNFDTTGVTPIGDNWVYSVEAWVPVAKGGEGGLIRARDARYVITYNDGGGSPATAEVKVDQHDPANQGRWVDLGAFFGVTKVELYNDITQKDADIGTITYDYEDYCVVADAVRIVPEQVGQFRYCSPVLNDDRQISDYNTTPPPVNVDRLYACTTNGRLLAFDLSTLGGSGHVTAGPFGAVDWIYPRIRSTVNPTPGKGDDAPSMGDIGASPSYLRGPGGNGNPTGYIYVPSLTDGDYQLYCVGDMGAGNQPTLVNGFTDSAWASGSGDVAPDPEPEQSPGFTSSLVIDREARRGYIGSVEGTFYGFDLTAGLALLKRVPANEGLPFGAFRFSTPAVHHYDSADARVIAPSTDGHIYALDANPANTTFLQKLSTSTTPAYDEPSLLTNIQGSPALDGSTLTGTGNNDGPVMYVGDMDGTLHWRSSKTGKSEWTYQRDLSVAIDSDTSTYENIQGWRCQGALFSSPNLTHFSYQTGGLGNYVYVGCADGRIYAFSNHGGAWGGMWSGGAWPFPEKPNTRANAVEALSPNVDIQVDLFKPVFQAATRQSNPDQKSGNRYFEPDYLVSGSEWILNSDMKVRTAPTSTGAAFDQAVDDALLEAARQRRQATDGLFPDLAGRTGAATNPIYFEWGEKLNVIIWNLPASKWLAGGRPSAAQRNIAFELSNTSPGSSAGTSVRLAGIGQLREYTVLDNSTRDSATTPATFTPLKYKTGKLEDVKRCYVTAQIDLSPTASKPYSPGTGWTLVVEIQRKKSDKSPYITQRIPIARLISGTPIKPDFDNEQLIGINNPLAIRDDQASPTSLGWPKNGLSALYERTNPQAHFNGNSYVDSGTGNYVRGTTPFINLENVSHGTASRQASLYVMDRSAVSCNTNSGGSLPLTIQNFRIEAGELRWRGGEPSLTSSGGVKFPWEYGPGSADYPNIYKQRQEYRKSADNGLPAIADTEMLGVMGGLTTYPILGAIGDYEKSVMRPEAVYTSVDIPRFQPANYNNSGGLVYDNCGYTRTMVAYLDSDNNNAWNSGDIVDSKPTTYQEVYRKFRVGVMVPPDYNIQVEEQNVDIGIAPHGLGEAMTGLREFCAYNPSSEIRQWFKPITIKNAGNVNLPNMQLATNIPLCSDQSNPAAPIPPYQITSSLDTWAPLNPLLSPFKSEPFLTSGFGYTLSKPRVGDADPTELTIPDKRKWDMNYQSTRTAAQNIFNASSIAILGKDNAETLTTPLPVYVSVKVPLSQPIGTYSSLMSNGNPYVPAFSYYTFMSSGSYPMVSPMSQKSFQLKVTVRESQVTGGTTPTSLAHIDVPVNALGDPVAIPTVGDSDPAAYKDAAGNVHLIWSSNRTSGATPAPSDMASAPWFLHQAKLSWDSSATTVRGWQPFGAGLQSHWWEADSSLLPGIGWPTTLLGAFSASSVLPWQVGGKDSGLKSVRHHSPTIALNGTEAWVVWAGDADVKDTNATVEKVAQEHRIFYTKMVDGSISSDDTALYSINHDPAMPKRSPSAVLSPTDRLWVFWQGGDQGKWSIFCSANDTTDHPSEVGSVDQWTPDMKLAMPSCMSSVSTPNAIPRTILNKPFFDVIYAGSTSLNQTPDIMLTRYAAATPNDLSAADLDALPANNAQPLPRVFDETLQRDSQYGFHTSQHLGWIRLGKGQTGVKDKWGEYAGDATSDLPYIHVEFPIGYELPDGTLTTAPKAVSATDASVSELVSGLWVPTGGSVITPTIDEATGTYTYKYPAGSEAESLLGETIVDFSAGIVRFTKPLKDLKNTVTGTFDSPEVHADYTPQTWRLTTDKAVDNSPRVFLEKTRMSRHIDDKYLAVDPNPGLGSKWRTRNGAPLDAATVDRLWVFWRKAGAGFHSSTIYYSTYRMGIDLAELFKRKHIKMDPNKTYKITDVMDATGSTSWPHPWEIDGSGRKVYFTQLDEGYSSLPVAGSTSYFGTNPPLPVMKINYSVDGVAADPIVASDVHWQVETSEQSLLGFTADGNINEGSIYAFADPNPEYWSGDVNNLTWLPIRSPKIWVFWTSTRGGTSDIFWETVSPNFAAK